VRLKSGGFNSKKPGVGWIGLHGTFLFRLLFFRARILSAGRARVRPA
jgi:hypothetical protein